MDEIYSSISKLLENKSYIEFCKYAKELGVPICINPDAHDTQGLKDVWYGTKIARKGWLEDKDVLNTKTKSEIEILFGK